jgi:hypothetical protein
VQAYPGLYDVISHLFMVRSLTQMEAIFTEKESHCCDGEIKYADTLFLVKGNLIAFRIQNTYWMTLYYLCGSTKYLLNYVI